MKQVRLSNGKQLLYPKLVYCYHGIQNSLKSLLLHPGFIEKCEQWRYRHQVSNTYADVFDGKIWSEFMAVEDRPFLAAPYNFAFMLNIDWFNPFKLSNYSLGAVYLTIMNLPRSERFKRENILLLSLIPGPSEPSIHINSFLQPMVDELLRLWTGIQMPIMVNGSRVLKSIRAALLCVASDMPAGRKCCGFLAHSANLGCTRCLKKFPGAVGHKDYSGFDRDTWIHRTVDDHRSRINTILKSRTKTQRKALESHLGCRYTELLRLPYFDPIRMNIVDPMHNMFLGTAKRMFKTVWVEEELLNLKHLETIQTRVDNILVPPTVGRIPRKISSQFSSFTADEWKNWITLYSIICLRDILPSEHLECWRHFVLAC